MRLVDAHCHIDTEWFDSDRDQVLARARAAGVTSMIVAANTVQALPRVLALAEQYECIHASIGVYPRYCAHWETDLERLRTAARHPRVVALGETGLDYSWNNRCPRETQQRAFAAQLALAAELGLPVIIHNSFQSYADCLDLFAASPLAGRDRAGMLHGFVASYGIAQRALELGLFLSLPGRITYPNARKLPALVAKLPLDRLLVETDAPCAPPHPYRGGRSEPAHVRLIAGRVAEIHGKSLEEVASITTANAQRLFRLDGG